MDKVVEDFVKTRMDKIGFQAKEDAIYVYPFPSSLFAKKVGMIEVPGIVEGTVKGLEINGFGIVVSEGRGLILGGNSLIEFEVHVGDIVFYSATPMDIKGRIVDDDCNIIHIIRYHSVLGKYTKNVAEFLEKLKEKKS